MKIRNRPVPTSKPSFLVPLWWSPYSLQNSSARSCLRPFVQREKAIARSRLFLIPIKLLVVVVWFFNLTDTKNPFPTCWKLELHSKMRVGFLLQNVDKGDVTTILSGLLGERTKRRFHCILRFRASLSEPGVSRLLCFLV